MIGLYTQNVNTLTQLLKLMQGLPIEAYQTQNTYEALLWLSDKTAPHNIPIIKFDSNSMPFTPLQWRLLVQKYSHEALVYQNKTFRFQPNLRLLINLNLHKQIHLTEKENAFLSFLVNTPTHKASRDDILAHVWQYSPEAETHTLESHLYALKQKLGADAENLVRVQDSIFSLV